MEESMNNGKTNLYHPNNFKLKTYWLYTEDGILEEPEQKTAQYEMDIKDEGFGKKLCIKIFSRVGTDPLHKRDYYTYFEVPVDCTFTRSLLEILKDNLGIEKI
jgi:hypothetical protein